jgi:hypothetical protein
MPDALRTASCSPRLKAAALLGACAALLLACSSPKVTPPPSNQPPAEPHEAADASWNWHGLMPAPFGSPLKDVHLTLHEVLLFRDTAKSPAQPDDAECYAADGPAPRFVGRMPDGYTLCFVHDRLSRIDASVDLPLAKAAQIFADACALWLKSATGSPAVPAAADTCEGREGAVHFKAHLAEVQIPEAQSQLSMTLDSTDRP